ncbi:MAG: hypothetical protein LQ340_003024 [Diploschistes diacapsis]|nr:MAG: hypothetical protein LQ340_003024 [Diploschistes diacapsis]
MFSDLPGIDPDFDYTLQGQCRDQSTYNPYDMRTPRSGPRSYGVVPMGLRPGSYPQPRELSAFAPVGCVESSDYNSSVIHNGYAQSPWGHAIPEAPVRPDGCHAWASKASPSPSFTDGSASEDGLNIASRQWNITAGKRDGFGYANHYLPITPPSPASSIADTHYGAGDCASYPPAGPVCYGNSCPASGIKMEDIQQYPDPYPEDRFDELNRDEIETIRANLLDTRMAACPEPEDQALTLASSASQIEPIKEESMEEEVEEEEEEEEEDVMSDYSPRSQRKLKVNHGTRLRDRAHRATKPTIRRSKRPNPSQVAKRPQKANAAHEAVPLSSSRISCPHCSQSLHSKASLSKHVATAHTRPFTCTFREYGCPSTFGSKNEWKRHVSSQHLRLSFWRCQLGSCYPQPSSVGSKEGREEELVFNDFNRKDLFMQHLRRMHAPHASSSPADRAAFNSSLENIGRQCFVAVRTTPPRSICGYCTTAEGREQIFEGPGTWENRMEHVGRHLESGHGEERAWAKDGYLERWLVEEGLVEGSDSKGWRLTGLPSEDGGRRR